MNLSKNGLLMNLKSYIKANKFKLYFMLLMTFLIIDPLPTPHILDRAFQWFLVLMLFFCPYLFTGSKKVLIIMASMFLYLVFDKEYLISSHTSVVGKINLLIFMFFFIGIIVSLLYYAVKHELVTEDLIFSGLTGFFLLGIAFMLVFETFQAFGLALFNTQEGNCIPLPKNDLFYYSLSNLSTLGIGDITPVTPVAKRLSVLESSIGALYVAVFIGRLVGLSIMDLRREEKKEEQDLKKSQGDNSDF